MSRYESRQLLIHKFVGDRFSGPWLDIEVLPELTAYRTLLVECAKVLWRRGHPDRERLPRNYESSIVLTVAQFEEGSVAVPIQRRRSLEPSFWEESDEVDEAVVLVAECIEAAVEGRALPERFPKRILELFEGYGRSLGPGEAFELIPASTNRAVRYTAPTRERLTAWAVKRYEDEVDLRGTVVMANVSPRRFSVRAADGGMSVEAPFNPEQEAVVLDALHHYHSARIRVRGRGWFTDRGELARITDVHELDMLPDEEGERDASARPIWSVIRDIMSDVPDDEFKKVPPSTDLDKALYGSGEST